MGVIWIYAVEGLKLANITHESSILVMETQKQQSQEEFI